MGNRVSLPVEGMTCGACAVTVQTHLLDQPGVADAAVNYATGLPSSSVLLSNESMRVAESLSF